MTVPLDNFWTAVVNGEEKQLQIAQTTRLVDVLRSYLNLTGTKVSCEVGRCGACMVLMDGEPVNSCLVMAYQCVGSEIITIEGLHGEKEGELHPIQQAFLEEGGFQCGYCTPGMVISTKALLDRYPQPSQEQIEAGLCGNLCRCTGYGGILRAVRKMIDEHDIACSN
ncbi:MULTISPECIES: (2Fe-2S)-binding protein [unclassified Paenibacillus]|uniref:(2Fe-2S)-binding protein n=1 Tax=unclassified Paenibacillus TaxID=185978 RepID=UPI00042361BF|nr:MULTISPECIES: (2Fe-2S)-binding protein [unclassified Paenibacillus]KGP80357.1 xanthine dehydrogenase [Paenibacillus sp. MAEPY2]KGP85337.1 xanthine dehydrogenase [Paenibacillus sp. MAEPY1]